jgi:hypothetical protein
MIKPQIIPFENEKSLEQWIFNMMDRNPGWSFFQHFDDSRQFPLLANVHYNSSIKCADLSFFRPKELAHLFAVPKSQVTTATSVTTSENVVTQSKPSWKDYFRSLL